MIDISSVSSWVSARVSGADGNYTVSESRRAEPRNVAREIECNRSRARNKQGRHGDIEGENGPRIVDDPSHKAAECGPNRERADGDKRKDGRKPHQAVRLGTRRGKCRRCGKRNGPGFRVDPL